ncbi:MAG: Peptidase family protein [Bacteroidota bacterium]|nr:Peptidase family protein [Bacteroidota bacterium]
MKKSHLLLVLAIIYNLRLSANVVSVQQAQTVALTFYKANVANAARNAGAVLQYTKTEIDNTVDFYVFDITPKGFVIVSATDNMEPVLAYSSESNFDASVAQRKGVAYWMTQTAAKIYGGIQQQVPADARISSLWSTYQQGLNPGIAKSGVVTPLVATTWNQEPYYNQLCPFNTTDNQRAVTGCVATAMAQIMKKWNFPAHGTGSFSYTDAPPSFSNNYGAQSANFANTTYNWTNMPNSIGAANTDIATLMYHCGVSVAMDYGDDNQGGSGAYVLQSEAGTGNPCAQKSYATYFGYNAATMQGVRQSNYTAAAWVTLLENELSAGRPIQYEGFDPGVGGHTWVCDGFDANNMFHMNWGWGGYDNGYFVITNLNPNPYVFNSNDAALIGIQPLIAQACNVPAGLSTTAITTASATFNWTAVTGATSYGIQYRKVGTTTWSTGTATTASFPVTGLTASTAYEWQVKTVCSSGSSAFTASSTFTTSAIPACNVPSGLSTSAITTTSAAFNWGAVSGATSYGIQYRKTGTTTWSTGTATAASFSVTGLTAATSYEWQVKTVCSSGSSAFTASTTFTTAANIPCNVPTTLTSSNITASGAVLSWGAVSGATRYNVEYKLASSSVWTTVQSTTNSCTISGLSSCSSYQFAVQTICSSGTSAFSAAASFSTIGCVVPYCTSKGTTPHEFINKVVIGTINNTSGNNVGYGNYVAQSTNLAGASTVSISLTPGFTSTTWYSEYWTVYIDYNHNGVFTDPGEMVLQGFSSGTITKSFIIPTTALNGATRMRIQMQYNAYQTNPCAQYNYGEVEDYTVNITGNLHLAAGDPELANTPEENLPTEMKLYPNPAQDVVTIEYNSVSEGGVRINIYNLAGQKMLGYEKAAVSGFNAETINTSALGNGIYIFELENNGILSHQRFIISK